MLRTGIPVLLLTALFLLGSAAIAEQATQTDMVTSEHDPNLQKTVTIDADDASLPTVLAILAQESGYNIVTGPGVNKEEKVSVHLSNTPIEEAMNLVVRAAGLSYEIVGNSFLVATSSKLKEEVGKKSHVIQLAYGNAAEVAELLKVFEADVTIDPTTNSLLIIASPKTISEIRSVVEQADLPPIQVMIEARIIEVAVEEEEKLGIEWNKLTPFEMVMYEGREVPTTASGGIEQMRTKMPVVAIDDLNDFGYFGRQEAVFDLAIDYLLKNNLAEVLANSKVATLNSKPAVVEVVDEIPFILSAGGVGGQVTTREKSVGIKLSIKPLVNSDGMITVEVLPEVSNVFQLIGPDQNIPWVVRRSAQTTIRVKDGETIVIAGLISMNRKNTIYKVPFLGDIPFIGGMFRHKNISNKKTDLIIQVTPHVVRGSNTGISKSKMVERIEEDVDKDLYEQFIEEDEEKENDKKAARQQAIEEDEFEDDADMDALRESLTPIE